MTHLLINAVRIAVASIPPLFYPLCWIFTLKYSQNLNLNTIFPDQVNAHGKYNLRTSSLKADNSCHT